MMLTSLVIINLIWLACCDLITGFLPVIGLISLVVIVVVRTEFIQYISIIFLGLLVQVLYQIGWVGSGDVALMHIMSLGIADESVTHFLQALTIASAVLAAAYRRRRFPFAAGMCMAYLWYMMRNGADRHW